MDSSTRTSVSNLNLLRGLTDVTPENIRSRNIQEYINQVAVSLLQPTPSVSLNQINALPPLVKLSVVKSAIDSALTQDNRMALEHLKSSFDLDIIGTLLGEPTERYAEIIEEYYTKAHTLSLHGNFSQKEIEDRLSKLSLAAKSSITELDLSNCFFLDNLSFLKHFPRITNLDVSHAYGLRTLEGIKHLQFLSTLNLHACRKLPNLDGLEGNNTLKALFAQECSYLSNTNGISNCLSLEELDLSKCNQLKDIKSINTLQHLKKLSLQGLANLKTTNICKALFKLEELHLEYSGVTDISAASKLPRLRAESIHTKGCRIKEELKSAVSTTD